MADRDAPKIKKIQNMLQQVRAEAATGVVTNNGMLMTTLANYIFVTDSEQRHGLTEEELTRMDTTFPSEMEELMVKHELLSSVRMCGICDNGASFLFLTCDHPGCDAVLHPECIGIKCSSKIELERIKAVVSVRCNKHTLPKEAQAQAWRNHVVEAPEGAKCFDCSSRIAACDIISCMYEKCPYRSHVQCLPLNVNLLYGINIQQLKQFRFVCNETAAHSHATFSATHIDNIVDKDTTSPSLSEGGAAEEEGEEDDEDEDEEAAATPKPAGAAAAAAKAKGAVTSKGAAMAAAAAAAKAAAPPPPPPPTRARSVRARDEAEGAGPSKRHAVPAAGCDTPAPFSGGRAADEEDPFLSALAKMVSQKDASEVVPTALTARKSEVDKARVRVMGRVKQWYGTFDKDQFYELWPQDAAPDARTIKAYQYMIVNKFFAAVEGALTKEEFEAAEFEVPYIDDATGATHFATLSTHLLRYLRADAAGAPVADLSPVEFSAVVRATFDEPTTFDAAAGTVVISNAVHPVTAPLGGCYDLLCASLLGGKRLTAATVGAQILRILDRDDSSLYLTNRTAEYDIDIAKKRFAKEVVHDIFNVFRQFQQWGTIEVAKMECQRT